MECRSTIDHRTFSGIQCINCHWSLDDRESKIDNRHDRPVLSEGFFRQRRMRLRRRNPHLHCCALGGILRQKRMRLRRRNPHLPCCALGGILRQRWMRLRRRTPTHIAVLSEGFEPPQTAPKAVVLSVTLRELSEIEGIQRQLLGKIRKGQSEGKQVIM